MTRRVAGLCARVVLVVCFATTMLASFPPLVSSSITAPRTRFMFLKKIRFRPTIRRIRSINFSRYVCVYTDEGVVEGVDWRKGERV